MGCDILSGLTYAGNSDGRAALGAEVLLAGSHGPDMAFLNIDALDREILAHGAVHFGSVRGRGVSCDRGLRGLHQKLRAFSLATGLCAKGQGGGNSQGDGRSDE